MQAKYNKMMQDFAKRRSMGRLLKSFGGALILLVLTVLAVRAAWGMYGKFAEAAQSDALSQKQLASLEQQQVQVAASVTAFSSERGIEEQIRERYGVVKPGEGQIQIVRDAATTTAQNPREPNLFIRAWQALFGWL